MPNTQETLQSIYRYIAATTLALLEIPPSPIPEYALENQKGDCGQVALLLITMLRYKEIPARWQSGWMTHPGDVNLHDWAEVYFEGTGWIPVDISFGRGKEIPIEPGREFFMSGIDSYRLYINSDFSGAFFPKRNSLAAKQSIFNGGKWSRLIGISILTSGDTRWNCRTNNFYFFIFAVSTVLRLLLCSYISRL